MRILAFIFISALLIFGMVALVNAHYLPYLGELNSLYILPCLGLAAILAYAIPRKDPIVQELYQEFLQAGQPEEPTIPDHRVLPHILFYGPGGSGKTTFTELLIPEIAAAYGHPIKYIAVTPSQLRSKRGLDGLMFDVMKYPYCVLFIDEVHGMPLAVEEALYSAMQDFYYDVTVADVIQLSESANITLETDTSTKRIYLPKFTLIGCTTLLEKINRPLRTRFTIKIAMEKPTVDDGIAVQKSLDKGEKPETLDEYAGQERAKQRIRNQLKSIYSNMTISFEEGAQRVISERGLGVTRNVVQYNKMIRNEARTAGVVVVDQQFVEDIFDKYKIDRWGLQEDHRKIIAALLESEKPIARTTLAKRLHVKPDRISDYEEELMECGMVTTDARSWMMATDKAKQEYNFLRGAA